MREFLALILMLNALGCSTARAPHIPPDQIVFRAVHQSFEDYRASSPDDVIILKILPDQGIIMADWYPVHKGEIELKIEALVIGSDYKIDAWQRSSWGIIRRPIKSDWSCRAESNVVSRIERLLSEKGESQ